LLEAAIIADDLTGAADTGIQFRRNFARVSLQSSERISAESLRLAGQAVAVYTDSRGLTPDYAAQKARQAALALSAVSPGLIYKKIDSCLRGNLGQEIMAVIQAMDLPLCIIAPALPKQGRQTVDGIHLVHGQPLAQTETANDPVCPVNESRLAVLLARQSGAKVEHLSLRILGQGPEAIERKVAEMLNRGVRLISCDARDQADLDHIAHLALGPCQGGLFAGSAGLAESISRLMVQESGAGDGAVSQPATRMLLVCGSATNTTRLQVEQLKLKHEVDEVSFPPAQLQRAALDENALDSLELPREIIPGTPLILRVGPEPPAKELEAPLIVRGLALAADQLMRHGGPDALFMTGGDTASAMFDQLKVNGLELDKELCSGMILGTLQGGRQNGLQASCKSGGFGNPGYLARLVDYWKAPS
jgi:uncharacterized protein YgbK (DUF1537 family)